MLEQQLDTQPDTISLSQDANRVTELENEVNSLRERLSHQISFSATLAQITEKGYLECGVSTGLPGFSMPNAKGEWHGLDVEFCQAVAAAALGDKAKVKFIPLNARERFKALQSGDIDLLSRNTTWTLQRDTALELHFAGILFYDGQGFMVKKSLNANTAKDLSGASICVQSGTTTELNLEDYFKLNQLTYTLVPFDTAKETIVGFEENRCDVLTADQSGLYGLRLSLKNAEDAVILPDIISKEPLGPVVRQGDDQWFNIVKWTLNAMINAEELGITSENIDTMKNSDIPEIRRFLGLDGPQGKSLGLNPDWAYQIIKQVGNYGESFDRTVGVQSPLHIQRAQNNLWSQGGLHYAPPIR
ncbi:amino acid ABC transporter substrate-binding protein [Photobacterium sp. GJ3]|uniref:amino acid ABC transporter substrate-binding protein n=1 Tax=Photobacterium sp. GJ3 TaxID=2829502 RepID=UPI0020111F37|nr:amino acid ABC transporter substrate-binding protein [Photobacterium sp. GJ3]